ncbi:light-induced protein, chloroplastic-like [Olea europaea var. sylvestris]|uniref:light-induced protein, chloroplastic-like n=1 Tax=Olea europaea var. sylvestris TaxID=158386 RepID=UPI000C1D5834|nr:light-induced protein, chloroplastic-like [Olea europaea var. sylvestris]
MIMASISSPLYQFPCMALQRTSQTSKMIASSRINSINKSGKNPEKKLKRNYAIMAVLPGKWGPEKDPKERGLAVLVEPPLKEPTEIEKLKKKLMDSFNGTNRGLSASSETRAEIVELITQLEAQNPTPAPMEALTLLNGKWILA